MYVNLMNMTAVNLSLFTVPGHFPQTLAKNKMIMQMLFHRERISLYKQALKIHVCVLRVAGRSIQAIHLIKKLDTTYMHREAVPMLTYQ